MRRSHGVGEPIQCRYCPKTDFSTYQGYQNHMYVCTQRPGKLVEVRQMNSQKVHVQHYFTCTWVVIPQQFGPEFRMSCWNSKLFAYIWRLNEEF